jgi:hypothetical protein
VLVAALALVVRAVVRGPQTRQALELYGTQHRTIDVDRLQQHLRTLNGGPLGPIEPSTLSPPPQSRLVILMRGGDHHGADRYPDA